MRIKHFIIFCTVSFCFGLCGSKSSAQVITTYYKNGKKKSEGILKDSVRIGLWQTWYENGQLQDSGIYTPCNADNTKLINLTKNYVEEGINTDTASDSVSFHRFTDTLILKDMFSFPSGNWIYYWDNGKVREKGVYSPNCIITIWCDDIAEKQEENSDLYIPYTPVDQYQAVFSLSKTGGWKLFGYEGNPWKEYSGAIQEGVTVVVKYVENKIKILAMNYEYNLGEPEFYTGKYTEWFNNGKIKLKEELDSDGHTKTYLEYYENGNQAKQRNYNLNGEPAGISRDWDANGKLVNEIIYDDKGKQHLDKKVFNDKILNGTWKFQESTGTYLTLKIKADSVRMVVLFWSDQPMENCCKYELIIKNNYFKIFVRTKQCSTLAQKEKKKGRLYGYLVTDDKLKILLGDEKKLKLNDNLLKQKEWMELTKVKE